MKKFKYGVSSVNDRGNWLKKYSRKNYAINFAKKKANSLKQMLIITKIVEVVDRVVMPENVS